MRTDLQPNRTRRGSNHGIGTAACHTMSLSTQGKEVLRNIQGDLVRARARACETGTLTQRSVIPSNLQLIVPEIWCFSFKS